MTSIIKFTPISGGLSKKHPPESPHCYVLEVDQFTFLLDCGWDSNFSTDIINELKKWVPKIDAVLLSYPDNLHIGALPYAVGKLGLSCPIYATVPVYKMGQMFMYDTFQARHSIEEFDLFSLDDVDKMFEMITQLKYNQSISLKGKGEGIVITPIPAGHMIGGAIWKIVKDGEEDIVYAVDFNHKKERHLNSCDIDKIQRPSLLITDGYNATHKQMRRRNRDELLMTNILQTLRNGGNVLLCVDTAGRVLELAHMVDHLWQIQDSGLLAYSLALLTSVSYNVIEFAKSQIEWMSEKLMRNFEGQRNNPFHFRHLKLCHSMSEVNKVPSPKVVLASMPDMECGFARDLFMLWCTNPKNSIIVTSRTGEGTLAHDLVKNGSDRTIELEVKKRVKLSGSELEDYRRREKEEGLKAKQSESMMDDESSDEEMEVESGKKHDIIMKSEPKQQTGFFKSIKAKYPMYPFHEEKIKYDDYGEILRPDEMMDSTGDDDKKEGPESILNHVDDADFTEVPTKCVSTRQTFHVSANILFIDFEGRSDGESITKVVHQMKPRRVIVVRGKEDSLNALADFCRQIVGSTSGAEAGSGPDKKIAVFIPKNGEVVDATTESFIYQVRLPEALVSRLDFSAGKDGLLAWVDGVIRRDKLDIGDVLPIESEKDKEESSSSSTGGEDKKKLTEEEIDRVTAHIMEEDDAAAADKKVVIPTLQPVPDDEIQGHQCAFVNELKLSDFKMVLMRNGILSEFKGGVLYCGSGSVALKRHDSGRVTIEGTVSEEYFVVRSLLYEQYAIL